MHHITDKCSGCTACASSCPVSAIEGEPGTRHVIIEKRCVDCGVCGRICPVSAVNDGDGVKAQKVKRADFKKPHINKDLCSACSMCLDICRFSCLAISNPVFQGDIAVFAELREEKGCVGCGVCASICPLKAISMKGGGAY